MIKAASRSLRNVRLLVLPGLARMESQTPHPNLLPRGEGITYSPEEEDLGEGPLQRGDGAGV